LGIKLFGSIHPLPPRNLGQRIEVERIPISRLVRWVVAVQNSIREISLRFIDTIQAIKITKQLKFNVFS
jgi:hypothetical protein